MVQFIRSKKLLLAAITVAIIGFASYGSYNIVQAFTGTEQVKNTGGTAVSISTSVSTANNNDGSCCSPYGCAGCNGCTNPQYEQAATDVSGLITENVQSYE